MPQMHDGRAGPGRIEDKGMIPVKIGGTQVKFCWKPRGFQLAGQETQSNGKPFREVRVSLNFML